MQLSPSVPLHILKNYNIRASKKLGQHFLSDFDVVQKIIKISQPLEKELVLEIGPGLGILTAMLLKESLSKLICIEYDKRCLEYLKESFSKEEKLILKRDDALKIDESQFINGNAKLNIISNLPYNISTVLLVKWLKKINLFKKMTLMFQKEVVKRICAQKDTKEYGILSVLTQFLCIPQLEFEVGKSSFFPQPKVDSAVVSIIPKKDLEKKLSDFNRLEHLCKTVFNKRRKVLKNSIASILENPEQELLSVNIDPNKRPENLSIEEFERIIERLTFI